MPGDSSIQGQQDGRAELGRLVADRQARPVASPLFIANLLRRSGRRMFALDGGMEPPAPMRLEGLEFHQGRRVVRSRFEDRVVPMTAGHRYDVVLAGPGAATVFESTCVHQRGSLVLSSVPTEVRQAGIRCSPRVTLADGWRVELWSAGARAPLTGRVADVGSGGFSCWIEGGGVPRLGERVSLRLDLSRGPVEGEGVVRRLGQVDPEKGTSCGIELLQVRPGDALHWHEVVRGLLYPGLRPAAAGEAWRLMEASRYVELWAGPHREHLQRRFLAAWDRPSPEVGHTVMLDGARGPTGMVTTSLLYPGSWLVHQMGVTPGEDGPDTPEQAASLLCGLMFEVGDRVAVEHLVLYVERNKRWNDRNYGDFAESHADEQRVSWAPVRLHRWTRSAGATAVSPLHPGVTIVPAQPWLWSRLATRLRSTLSPVERRAFAFEEDQIALEEFSGRCRELGHERRRQAYFALRAGQPVAAVVVETGDEGVNIFGLFNTARLFSLRDQPPDVDVQTALALAAVDHFRAAGKEMFLWMVDEDLAVTDAAERLGMTALPPGMRWIAHREKIPAWNAYLQTLLGGTSGTEAVEVQEPVPALDREGYGALRDQLDFRPSLVPTLGIVALDVLLVAAAVALLQRAGWAAWLTSQALLAVVFFNAFSILHECGHGSASRRPLVNTVLGHLASTFCFVPYFPWKLIHRQHHLWTGNLDRDPSLRSLRRFRDQGVPKAVAWSWRAWIPLAGLMQHLVFLTYPMVLHRAGGLTRGRLARTIISILWLPASWLALWRLAPGLVRPGHVGGAFLLFLVMEELVNLPHHVGMPTSNERLPPWEQHRATRSCYYPRGLSELLVLNFNFHVEHHLFPSLPWYRLRQARGLLQRTMAGRYQECAGASWNLRERARPLELVIGDARPRQERA